MTTDTSFPITGQPSPLLSQTLMSTVLPKTCHLSWRCNTALSEISNPSIYFPGPPWGYELASLGVTGSSPYPTLHKDSSMVFDGPAWIHLNSLQYNVSSYGSYERTLDFTTRYGWKPTRGKAGLEKVDCGQFSQSIKVKSHRGRHLWLPHSCIQVYVYHTKKKTWTIMEELCI